MRADAPITPSPVLPKTRVSMDRGRPTDPPSDRQGLSPHGEWLLTDAQGGFAMGTVMGLPMRRYHGLLCVALAPPVRRTMMLTALDEHLHVPQGGTCGCDMDARLSPFQFGADESPPDPSPSLVEFVKTPDSCVWVYSIPTQIGRINVRKTLAIAERGRACAIDYEIEGAIHAHESETPVTLTLRPLLAMRDFHELNHPGTLSEGVFSHQPTGEPMVEGLGEGVMVSREGLGAVLDIRGVGLRRADERSVWRGIRYRHETLRQQSDIEDLYCPGAFTMIINPRGLTTARLECRVWGDRAPDWANAIQSKRGRLASSVDHALRRAGDPESSQLRDAIAMLACAADDFVVDRLMGDSVSASVIAGYPWFSDWGRDTMIALPGLLLCTGRIEEALGCLRTFAAARRDGLIPNRFDDDAGPAHYNTVDAPLWFVHACAQWSHVAGSPPDAQLVDACDDILDAYARGTINRIGMDQEDALIRAGDEHTQLTWMDALRDGVAFTPRHGKAIEINALWINAIESRMRMGALSDSRGAGLEGLAQRARRSMVTRMTQGPGGGLVDCLIPVSAVRSFSWRPSEEIRPNQVFACSLPHVGLPEPSVSAALRLVGQKLLTPVGLRTLDPDDPAYAAHYRGSMFERDRAYHNGTVWPWLLGPFAEGLMRSEGFSDASCRRARELMLGLASRMRRDSAGQLFEIYDAEPDASGRHAPNGCPAQAWSIAETLRILILSCSARADDA